MKKVYIKEEQIQFICPVTNKVILDLDGEGDFNPSDAMLFCYVESEIDFMNSDPTWARKQLAICLEELDNEKYYIPELKAFKNFINKDFHEYPNLVCYVVNMPGGGYLNHTDTIYFGINMEVKN